MARTTLEILKRAGAFVDPNARRGRGRPRVESMGSYSRAREWAIAVFKEMELLGGARGSQAAAIAKVARREPGYSRDLRTAIESRIKMAVKRHRGARIEGETWAFAEKLTVEIERRTRGFPDDVRDSVLSKVPANRLLEYLRTEGIDGTCPADLIAFVRSRSE